MPLRLCVQAAKEAARLDFVGKYGRYLMPDERVVAPITFTREDKEAKVPYFQFSFAQTLL